MYKNNEDLKKIISEEDIDDDNNEPIEANIEEDTC